MLRREIREDYCKENAIGAFNELVLNDYALWLETQLHFAKEELSQLRQPAVCSMIGQGTCLYEGVNGKCTFDGNCVNKQNMQ